MILTRYPSLGQAGRAREGSGIGWRVRSGRAEMSGGESLSAVHGVCVDGHGVRSFVVALAVL